MHQLKSEGSKVDRILNLINSILMKSHLFISVGLLIAAIFFMRGLEVMSEPGIGLLEVYILGGFLVAGLLIHAGVKERRASKKTP